MARSFASGDYIENDPGLAILQALSFWMRTTQSGVNGGVAAKHFDANSEFGWTLNTTPSGNLGLSAKQSGFVGFGTSTATVNDGAWRHVALQLQYNSGGTNILYIDGASAVSWNASTAWGTAIEPLRFARVRDAFWTSFVGEMAEIGQWNAPLTADEVTALAKGFSPRLIRPSALISYLPLVREVADVRGAIAQPTTVGTTASAHPRVIG